MSTHTEKRDAMAVDASCDWASIGGSKNNAQSLDTQSDRVISIEELCGLELILSKERGAFSVDEFCRWASIGRSLFYQEVKSGRIKLRKIGRKSVVIMPDAMSWLKDLPVAK